MTRDWRTIQRFNTFPGIESVASPETGGDSTTNVINTFNTTENVTNDYTTAIPAGTILMTGRTTAPSGFVLCDGTSYVRANATYSALYSAIGTAFGAVDGTHFTVPDLRGKFPIGKATAGTGSTLGGTGGLIDHKHTVAATGQQSGGDNVTTASLGGATDLSKPVHTHSVPDSGTNNPPFQAVNFIISLG